MRVIEPKIELVSKVNGLDVIEHIEKAGRVYYSFTLVQVPNSPSRGERKQIQFYRNYG